MASTPAVAAAAGAVAGGAPEWVVFGLDGRSFGVPLGRVRVVLTPRPFTRLPGCGPEVCGLTALRGRVVTVFDFGAVLGLRAARTLPDHRLLLLESGDHLVGFTVDEVLGVAPHAARATPPAASLADGLDLDAGAMLGVGLLDDRAFLELDAERILRRLLA